MKNKRLKSFLYHRFDISETENIEIYFFKKRLDIILIKIYFELFFNFFHISDDFILFNEDKLINE